MASCWRGIEGMPTSLTINPEIVSHWLTCLLVCLFYSLSLSDTIALTPSPSSLTHTLALVLSHTLVLSLTRALSHSLSASLTPVLVCSDLTSLTHSVFSQHLFSLSLPSHLLSLSLVLSLCVSLSRCLSHSFTRCLSPSLVVSLILVVSFTALLFITPSRRKLRALPT